MDAELIKLWQAHYSAKQIAEKMAAYNVTRNSVIGRAHRILKKQDSPIQARGAGKLPPEDVRAPRVSSAFTGQRRRIAAILTNVIRPKTILIDVPRCEDLNSLQISLDDLKPHQCRWPSGDRAPYTFCGHQKFNGYSYCPTHHFRSIGNGTPSERVATRIAPHKLAGAW